MEPHTKERKTMKICSKCVLPDTFPGISFNSSGICVFCDAIEKSVQSGRTKDLERKFLEVVERNRGTSLFDCVVAYSGGKDSSYLLDLLVGKYDLKVLAVTFDNWFLSDRALSNIRVVTKALDVSHILIRPPYGLMKRLFHKASKEELYSRKSLERASTICTTCISFVRFSCLRTALEKDIPLVVFGFNPGQMPEGAGIVKTNAALLRALQHSIYGPISAVVNDEARAFFLEERHFSSGCRFPHMANPFAFVDYREEEIYARIHQVGWQQVVDTDENSTNCLLNSYANVVHYNKYGYHPYVSEIAKMVRRGEIDRAEGLRRVKAPQVNQLVMAISRQLNE